MKSHRAPWMTFIAAMCFPYTACVSQWSAQHPIPKHDASASQRGVLFNNMAISSKGRIFILTSEYKADGVLSGNYLSYTDRAGSDWTGPVRFLPADKVRGATPMKIAMDSRDVLHVLWAARDPNAVLYSQFDHDLRELVGRRTIAPATDSGPFALHLSIDRSDRLHAIWHEGAIDTRDPAECFHSRSTDGGTTWSTPTLISADDGAPSAFPRGQFDAARGDSLAIVWRDSATERSGWDVMMTVSHDGGNTWGAPLPVATSGHDESDPDVIVDSHNRLHVVFHEYPRSDPFFGANIRYGYSDDLGRTWDTIPFRILSEPGIRSHLVEGNRFDGRRGVLWLVWKDERDRERGDPSADAKADIYVAYSKDRGATWSEPERATDLGDLTVGYKAGVVVHERHYPGGTPTFLGGRGYAINYDVLEAEGLWRVYLRLRTSVGR